jgi:sulfofructose kinase
MTPDVQVLSLGYITLDVICRVRELPEWDGRITAEGLSLGSGGMAANAAVAAARAGARSAVFGQVGSGGIGDAVLGELEAHGVRIDEVDRPHGAETATCVVLVDDEGRRAIISEPFALDWTGFDAFAKRAPAGDLPTVVHVDGYHLDPAVERSAVLRSKGWLTAIDLDGRTELDAETLDRVAQHFDVVVANAASAELAGLAPAELARSLAGGSARAVAVTLGADGAMFAAGDADPTSISAPPVDVTDTTGAGDVFTGSFVARLLQGADIEAATIYAVTAASLSTTAPGARGRVPAPDEVEALSASAARQTA